MQVEHEGSLVVEAPSPQLLLFHYVLLNFPCLSLCDLRCPLLEPSWLNDAADVLLAN